MAINILYSCNQAYVTQTMVSIESLLYHNQQENVNIYIVQDQIEEDWLARMKSRVESYHQQLVIIDLQELLRGRQIEINGRHPQTIFVKLFAEYFTEDRLLYLDSDTVINGSLKELFEEDMGNNYVAGVCMPYSSKRKQSLGLDEGNIYVCDGILLIDVKQWREQHIGQQCMEYAEQNNWNPPGLSEGIINVVCKGHIKKLSPKYNLMGHMILFKRRQIMKLFCVSEYYSEEELQEAKKMPIIIHYLNELYNRPWNEKSDHPYASLYWHYLNMAGIERVTSQGKLGKKTCLTRILFRSLPFSVFSGLYHVVHKEL